MAYLSGRTKEHAILIDEDDDQAHQSKPRLNPPPWSSKSGGTVVDLTLSDDDVTIVEGQSVARSAQENRRRNNHQNANNPPNVLPIQANGNSFTERVIPRTHPAKTTPHTARDRGEGTPTIRNGEKAQGLPGEASPSRRLVNAGLPERSKPPATSRAPGNPFRLPLPWVSQSNAFRFPHVSPKTSFSPTGLQEQALLSNRLPSIRSMLQEIPSTSTNNNSLPPSVDKVDRLESSNGEAVLQNYQKINFGSVNNSSGPVSSNSRIGVEERTDSTSFGSVEEPRPQLSNLASFQRKQRAIKSASRLGEDRISRPRPPMNQPSQSHAKEPSPLSGLQEASIPRSNGDKSPQSSPMQGQIQEPMGHITAAINSSVTEKLKVSDATVGTPSAVTVHENQDEASSPSVNGKNHMTASDTPLPDAARSENLQEMIANTEAMKAPEQPKNGISWSRNTEPGPAGDFEIPSNEQAGLEEIVFIDVDDYNAARSTVEVCLKQQLVNRHEVHASLTRSKMWQQRICFESELKAQHRQRRGPPHVSLPDRYVQSVSPFEDISPIEAPFDKKAIMEGIYDFSQETFIPAKPKDAVARSGWISSTTKYKSTAVCIPMFKEYVSVNNNILIDNESKLLATPYFQEEDDKSRMELRALLPQHYEMKHDINALSDLRNEQCRFYKDTIETFLRKIHVSWSAILFWLLASDHSIKRINNSFKGSSGFENLLLQRLVYRTEDFVRDEETLTANLFDPDSKRRQRLLSTLEEPTVRELRLSALACATVLEECGFSIWYLARQSDIMSKHVSEKIKEAVTISEFAYRDALCRVCHQHYCLLHGELREAPKDFWETNSNSSGTSSSEEENFDDFDNRHSSTEGIPPRHDSQRHSNHSDVQDEDDEDDPTPAHWDDDSDIEKVINYKLPTNPDAFNTNPEVEMIESRGSKPPKGQFNRKWWHDNTYAHRWDKRKPFFPCSHEGSCEQARCRCFRENITCEKTCKCSDLCNRRFPGCNCAQTSQKRVCASTTCLCVKFNRECDADLCGTCGASEILDSVNKYNEDILSGKCFNVAIQRGVPKKTLLGHSEVHGFGLYVGEEIKKDEYIGEYVGETVSVQEGVRRYTIYNHQQTMYLFKLNTKQEVDATFMGNKLRFINDANKKFTNCAPRNLLCNTVFRLALYATTDIKAGTELFFYYNYPKETTAHFKQPTGQKGSVDAVKQTVKPTTKHKHKSKDSSSTSYKPSGPPTLSQSLDQKARVNAGLEKARAAKKKKRDVALVGGSMQDQIQNGPGGPHRARKAAFNQAGGHRTSRVVQLSRRDIKNTRRLNSEDRSNVSDFSVATDDSEQLRQRKRIQNDKVIQDTDEEDINFAPEGTQEGGGEPERSTSRPRRSKATIPTGSLQRKVGEHSIVGRKRRIVLNSDEE